MIKKTYLAAAFVFAVSLSAMGQTTQEEYNYITKGYKIQVESGLDMKKGYSFYELHPTILKWSEKESRNCYFKALIRDGESKPCAIMMIYKKFDVGAEYYICIPTLNTPDDIWQQTFQDLIKISEAEDAKQLMHAMVWSLMKLSSELMNYVEK